FEASRAQTEAQRALALAEAAQLSSRIGGEDLIGALGVVFRRVAEVAGFDRWMMLRQREDQPGSMDVLLVQGPEGVPHRRDTVSLNTPLPYATSIRQGQALLFNQTEEQALLEGDEAYAKAYVQQWGKHIATPIVIGTHTIGGILMGRHLDGKDVDERDQQLIETLASQVAVALENRRLFEQAQSEQRTLRLILETLPAGVLVLDAYTLKPVQFNDQASALLRKEINLDEQFSVEAFNLYRTGTQLFYPEQELPISIALATGQEASTDDIAIITDKIQTDLLMNAAPITDRDGQVSSIVVAMQDITSLRSLENTLQENLRETVSLYEAQRQVAEAGDLDEVLDVMLTHLILQQPLDTFILTADRAGYLSVARSYLSEPEEPDVLLPLLDEQETVVIWDLASVEYDADARGALHAMGASAAIILPINVSMEKLPFGWIVVLTDSVDMAGADQERIYTQLRDVVATAIDNRLLIDSQQAALSEVRSLYNATNAISRARDIDQITEALAEAIQVFEADYVFGYLAEDAGLQSGEIMLFDQQADDAAVDFRAIMAGYDIPPGGVYINDLMRISERVETEEHLLRAGIRSFAAVTLRPKDMSSGLLLIAYREPHLFTEAEDRYLNTLADGASVVFNTFVLFDQIQSALEETSTLYQASRALSDATSAEEILDVVVNYLIAPHVNQVFIALMQSGDDWSDPAAVVEVAASWSEDDSIDLSGLTLMRSQFPIWDFLASPTVVTVDDIYGDPRLDEATRSGVESLQVRSLVVVPLRVAKRAIGAVWLGSSMPHIHDDRERRTFQAFAEQASLSLEAAYLLSQTERRARQLQTSAEVSQSASQILDLEELMPRLVSLIKDAFGYDHVQIFLMDEANEYAELRASTGEAGRQLLAIHHKLKRGSDSVIGMVTQTGQPQIALDTAEAGVVHRPNQYLPLTRSEMALPLIIKGQVVGALDVQSNQPNAFIEEDIKALTTLAAQIAVAIDNANLYEAAQNQVNRMSFLFEITSTAAAGESLEDSFQRIAERLHETLEPLSVVAYQPQVYVDERDEDIEFAALKAVAQAGLAQPLTEIEEVRLDDTQKLMAEVAVSRQAFVIDDIEKEARYLPIAQHARSAVLVPMVASGELVGLLVMEDDRPTAYGPDTLQLLLTMSGSLSAIVQSIQLLDQLQRTNEQLRELDRLKSDFLANMSHELRTPLNSIIGFSRVMLKGIDGPLTEMQEQDLTTIYNSGQHLLMLINDILDQAKIAAEKLDLKFDYFEVKPLAEGVRSIGIGLVKDKVVDLRLEMAPNMPRVYGDEFRTRQILLNLVSNAAKFTQEGTITIKVYPIVQEDGLTMVRFDVADTGIGIAEKDLPLLFEAFRQVDSSLTRTQGGTGLGLPIAKSLAELQGGEMTVASTVNVGSTFSFTIPTEPVVDENGEDIEGDADLSGTLDEDTMVASVTGPNGKDVDAAARPSDDDTLQIKKETRQIEVKSVRTAMEASKVVTQVKRDVLLIEENKDMVDQFRRTLQREGYEVFTADHPSYAEAMAGNLRPTAIVMDVNFANGEGWNLLARLKDRDDTFDIPIVVVTLSNESERAYQTGAYHFIQRPFVPEDLAAAVLNAEKEHAVDRILIIDDDEEAVRLLTQLLNDAGQYRVFAARNAAEGISLVARRRPNLIILDLRMPEKDGFAVLEELRNNPETASIPVLVVTGEMNLNAEEQARLHDVRVLQKTAISQEEHDAFIRDVQAYLNSDRE
ncbi:MAG: GAF domain-containing protein, partial [Chloroflexota bacterium]